MVHQPRTRLRMRPMIGGPRSESLVIVPATASRHGQGCPIVAVLADQLVQLRWRDVVRQREIVHLVLIVGREPLAVARVGSGFVVCHLAPPESCHVR